MHTGWCVASLGTPIRQLIECNLNKREKDVITLATYKNCIDHMFSGLKKDEQLLARRLVAWELD
jgi:hypothetical protein